MKHILDTCTFVWLCAEPEKLSEKVSALFEDEQHTFVLSQVSVLELSLKWTAKKITLPAPPRVWIAQQCKAWQISVLPLNDEAIYRSTELPLNHKDPFDRLLVGQAIAEGCAILSPDKVLASYPLSCIW